MTYLNPDELKKLIFEIGEGRNLRFYSFKSLSNAPTISIDIQTKKIQKCDCKQHTIKGMKVNCRFTEAMEKYLLDRQLKPILAEGKQ